MTFRELYCEALKAEQERRKRLPPHRVFLEHCAKLVARKPETISAWVSGRRKPPLAAAQAIAEYYDSTVEALFPNYFQDYDDGAERAADNA